MKQTAKKRRDHHLFAKEEARKNNAADKHSSELLKAGIFQSQGKHMLNQL